MTVIGSIDTGTPRRSALLPKFPYPVTLQLRPPPSVNVTALLGRADAQPTTEEAHNPSCCVPHKNTKPCLDYSIETAYRGNNDLKVASQIEGLTAVAFRSHYARDSQPMPFDILMPDF